LEIINTKGRVFMKGLVEFSIVPIGTKETSVGKYVKSAYELIKESGLNFEFHSMGTVIEGDIEKILDIIIKINEKLKDEGVLRIVTSVKIDYRIDKISKISDKIKSVTGGLDERENT
jgi:uncharacterized protein (TIGR00106 family)